MIEHRVGDIFKQKDITHIVHQANLFHTFGSGIAAQIKRRYPYAFEADLKTKYGDPWKLGTVSWGVCDVEDIVIINAYCQIGINAEVRQTDYIAMRSVFVHLENHLAIQKGVILGIPHKIGCGLGGGDWKIVLPLIRQVFENSALEVVICQLPKQ